MEKETSARLPGYLSTDHSCNAAAELASAAAAEGVGCWG